MNNNSIAVVLDRSKRFFGVFKCLIVLVSLLLSGCKIGKGQEEQVEEENAPVPVEVTYPARGEILKTYRTITTLEAENEADVVARSTGVVEKLLVEEGDMVSKGQLLAQLDVEQLTLELQQNEATLKRMKNELDRQKTLSKRKLGQSDQLDRARFDYQSQQAQFELAKLRLRYASIKAPINGIVTERLVKPGNLIRDNELLFKIVDLDTLIAVLHLPEKELANVKKQQKVVIDIDAMQGKPVIGYIDRIRPSVDTDTGTFRVIAKLGNEDHYLKSGMFGKVEVVFDVRQNSLLLEQDALITQDNRSHVFIVDGEKARQTPVVLGFKHLGRVEILEGLSDSDAVIITGQQLLKHDSNVEVINPQAGGDPAGADNQ